MERTSVYAVRAAQYTVFEKQSRSKYERRCINGNVVGPCKCVGYCRFDGHPGFLTDKLRHQHDCIRKQCNYYIPKIKNMPVHKKGKAATPIFSIIEEKVKPFEGMRILHIEQSGPSNVELSYITISNEYPLALIAAEVEKEHGIQIQWKRLNYSLENCIRLILAS